MTVTAGIAREEAITDALRVATAVIGDEPATQQALQIIAAIKRLRLPEPVRVATLVRVDYLSRVQEAAQAAWKSRYNADTIGAAYDATAGIDTPIGRLTITTWRTRWADGRIAWSSEYMLDQKPITIAEIKAAGLAQRPTIRARRSTAI